MTTQAERVMRRFLAGRLQLGPAQAQPKNTAILQATKKLPARNQGDLNSALLSAGFYAKKLGHPMHVYQGTSFMHIVWRVSDKPGEYLNPINNNGEAVFSVSPELVIERFEVHRGG